MLVLRAPLGDPLRLPKGYFRGFGLGVWVCGLGLWFQVLRSGLGSLGFRLGDFEALQATSGVRWAWAGRVIEGPTQKEQGFGQRAVSLTLVGCDGGCQGYCYVFRPYDAESRFATKPQPKTTQDSLTAKP